MHSSTYLSAAEKIRDGYGHIPIYHDFMGMYRTRKREEEGMIVNKRRPYYKILIEKYPEYIKEFPNWRKFEIASFIDNHVLLTPRIIEILLPILSKEDVDTIVKSCIYYGYYNTFVIVYPLFKDDKDCSIRILERCCTTNRGNYDTVEMVKILLTDENIKKLVPNSSAYDLAIESRNKKMVMLLNPYFGFDDTEMTMTKLTERYNKSRE